MQSVLHLIGAHGAPVVSEVLVKMAEHWNTLGEPVQVSTAQLLGAAPAGAPVKLIRYDLEPIGLQILAVSAHRDTPMCSATRPHDETTVTGYVLGAYRIDLRDFMVLPTGDLLDVETRAQWELTPAERDFAIALGINSEFPPCPDPADQPVDDEEQECSMS